MTDTIVDDGPSSPSRRRITPRRALPNGRAVVGALLVTTAATGAFLTATAGDTTPDTSYLVLTSPVAEGDPVTAVDVVAEPLDLGTIVAASALTSSIGLDGAIALRDLRAGELVLVDDLLASPIIDGEPLGALHELTIPVPLDRSPASLVPGDRVTILATVRTGDGSATVVTAEDAVVLRFDTGADRIGSRSGAALTLAVGEPEVVVAIAHLSLEGELTVVRSTRAIHDRYPPTAVLVPAPGAVEGQ